MRKPTIYDIKDATYRGAPFFFAAGTLSHFGQTMRSFQVDATDVPHLFLLSAPMWGPDWSGRTNKKRYMGRTERYYYRGMDRLFSSKEDAVKAIEEARKAKKNGWTLIDTHTEQVVIFGMIYNDFRGDQKIIVDADPPRREGSTGRVYTGRVDEHNRRVTEGEYYPDVFRMKWVKYA